MKHYEAKKLENCFSSSHVYEYRLPIAEKEEFLEGIAERGTIKCFKHFPRPCFQAVLADGTVIKGIMNEPIIKVVFPDSSPQISKERFEAFLARQLAKYIDDEEK